ncbi:hypothetical protein [Streptomyces canus]|nr:hypothetical protein [Streptomyces canus]
MNRLRSALWLPLFGATWWLPELEPGVRLDTVRGLLRDGPAA